MKIHKPSLWCSSCNVCACAGLLAALWSHTATLMRLLAAEPRSAEGLLFYCQYLRLMILVTRIR